MKIAMGHVETDFVQKDSLAPMKDAYATHEVPIGEGLRNCLEAEVPNVNIQVLNRDGIKYLAFMSNTHLDDPLRFYNLGVGEDNDGSTNHMKHVGGKIIIAHFSPKHEYSELWLRQETHFIKATYSYYDMKPEVENVELEKWPFGEVYSFVLLVEMEKEECEYSLENARDYLRSIATWKLIENPETQIVFLGKPLTPRFHATPNLRDDEARKLFYAQSEELGTAAFEKAEQRRNSLKFTTVGKIDNQEIRAAVTYCSAINGNVYVIPCIADKNKGDSDTTGIQLALRGIGVGNYNTECIGTLSTYFKSAKDFKAIDCTKRKECNALSFIVNLVPNNVNMSSFMLNDKTGIMINSELGGKIRKFIDVLIGDVFREAFRRSCERGQRDSHDQNMCELAKDSRMVYIREAVIKFDGYKQKIDAIMIPVSDANRAKVLAYLNGKTKSYILGKEDFVGLKEEINVDAKTVYSNLFLFEYKAIERKKLGRADVSQACDYAQILSEVFHLDRYKMLIKLYGPKENQNDESNPFVRMKRNEGYRISLCTM